MGWRGKLEYPRCDKVDDDTEMTQRRFDVIDRFT